MHIDRFGNTKPGEFRVLNCGALALGPDCPDRRLRPGRQLETFRRVGSCSGHALSIAGWWFQTFFIFHNVWDNPSQ